MSPRPPPRPPRRPLSVASSIGDFEGLLSEQGRAQSPTPSIVVKDAWPMSLGMASGMAASDKANEPLAIGIVIEEHEAEESGQTTPTASTAPESKALQPVSHASRPLSPSRPMSPARPLSPATRPLTPSARPNDPHNIFSTASALMSAVTSARGKNMIIGPCTCRTCSIGCLVALLAMATGRVEQLREDIAVEVYQHGSRKSISDGSSDVRCPSNTVRLKEAGLKLRDLVRTMAHLQLRDKDCRIMQASGTQFIVALPHVKVDYLRQRKRVTDTGVVDAPEEVKEEDQDSSFENVPMTPPLNVRKDGNKRDVRRPPRVEVPEGVGTGEFLGSAWGNFAWGARSNSLRSVDAQSYRSSRAVNRLSAAKICDDAMRMGALQVVLEAAGGNVERLEPNRVEPLPAPGSKIVVEKPQVPIAAPSSATIERFPRPTRSQTFGDLSDPTPSSSPPPVPSPMSPTLRTTSPSPMSPVERPMSPLSRTTSPPPFSPVQRPMSPPSRPLTRPPPLTDHMPLGYRSPSPALTAPSPGLRPPPSRTPSPLPQRSPSPLPSRSHSPLPSPLPSPCPSSEGSARGDRELTRAAAMRASNKVKTARDAQRTADETTQLRKLLATANAEIEKLRADRAQLEITVVELRGRLAAAETMLDTYEDLTREVEEERRQLEGDKFMLELENARLEKRNAMLTGKSKI